MAASMPQYDALPSSNVLAPCFAAGMFSPLWTGLTLKLGAAQQGLIGRPCCIVVDNNVVLVAVVTAWQESVGL
jgi:hypothetical protein